MSKSCETPREVASAGYPLLQPLHSQLGAFLDGMESTRLEHAEPGLSLPVEIPIFRELQKTIHPALVLLRQPIVEATHRPANYRCPSSLPESN